MFLFHWFLPVDNFHIVLRKSDSQDQSGASVGKPKTHQLRWNTGDWLTCMTNLQAILDAERGPFSSSVSLFHSTCWGLYFV